MLTTHFKIENYIAKNCDLDSIHKNVQSTTFEQTNCSKFMCFWQAIATFVAQPGRRQYLESFLWNSYRLFVS